MNLASFPLRARWLLNRSYSEQSRFDAICTRPSPHRAVRFVTLRCFAIHERGSYVARESCDFPN